MSALVLSVLLGLAATWTNARTLTELLEEFQKIVLEIVKRVVIPVLPVFIGFTFWGLSYEGTITKQLPVFIKIVLIVILGHFIWMAVLYLASHRAVSEVSACGSGIGVHATWMIGCRP